MTLKDFETELQKIDTNLSIVPHPKNEDMAGVYYKEAFVCGIPSNDIYEEKKPGYMDKFGTPHRTIPEAEAKVKSFLERLKNEDGFYELMTEKL